MHAGGEGGSGGARAAHFPASPGRAAVPSRRALQSRRGVCAFCQGASNLPTGFDPAWARNR